MASTEEVGGPRTGPESGGSGASFDDPEFAERFRERDPAAVRAVVGEYLPQVLRAAKGAGLPPAEADDVVQATFTTFIESAPRFEGRSHVRTWLFGILYKKIAEARRDPSREREAGLDDVDGLVEGRFDADGAWSRPPRPADARLHDREIREGIAECLDQAPTSQRMAFFLREVEGFSTEETSEAMGVTRNNLGVLLYRIRNRLRECLEAKGMG